MGRGSERVRGWRKSEDSVDRCGDRQLGRGIRVVDRGKEKTGRKRRGPKLGRGTGDGDWGWES